MSVHVTKFPPYLIEKGLYERDGELKRPPYSSIERHVTLGSVGDFVPLVVAVDHRRAIFLAAYTLASFSSFPLL